MTRVEFWFDPASTYSYPTAMRVEALAAEAGVEIAWRPFLLGPIFAAQGWTTSPFNLYPAKGRYMLRDLERLCEGYGLPFRRPSAMPRKSVLAARVALLAEPEGWCPAFAKAAFRANFAEDRDIGDPMVIGQILEALGRDAETDFARAVAPENKGRLRERTEAAARAGIFGAPSFLVGEELFWGDDRLEDALAWAARGQ